MQNSQEKPVFDDDISLVDLATTFIRRRHVFYLCFCLVTLLGVAYAFIHSDKYEYVTLIESAERTGGEFLEAPASTVAVVQNRWIPAAVSNYQTENKQLLPFNLESVNPDNTGLIKISSEASVGDGDLVKAIHRDLAQSVLSRQQRILEIQRSSLEKQIASIEKTIEWLKVSGCGESTSTALAAAIQKRAELEGDLEALQPGSILEVARQNTEQIGAGDLLIVVFFAISGAVLGVFAAFFAEFVARVRHNLNQAINN
jgi:hypothetical protein